MALKVEFARDRLLAFHYTVSSKVFGISSTIRQHLYANGYVLLDLYGNFVPSEHKANSKMEQFGLWEETPQTKPLG